jgi:hypothetical protein
VRYANSEFEIIDPAIPQIGKWRQFRDINYYFFSTKCTMLTANRNRVGARKNAGAPALCAQERSVGIPYRGKS